MTDDNAQPDGQGPAPQTVGQLLGRSLQAVGVTRIFGSSASGISGVPGLGHLRVDEPVLASLLADAQGRIIRGPGAALLPQRRLRLSSQPGAVVVPVVLDDPALLPEAIASWSVGSVFGAAELVLDLDLDAPAPRGVEPQVMDHAGQLMTLSPSLADFRMLVIAGPGVVRDNQVAALRAFASQAGVGVVNTWGAKGVFPWDDPHHFGTAGLQARDFELAGFGDAELVIAVGLDRDEAPIGLWAHGQVLDVEPIQLAALAYNWPEPKEVAPYPRLYTELARALEPLYESSRSPLSPARAARDLSLVRPKGGLVAADPGPAGLWVARTFPTVEPGSVVVPSQFVSGFAVAAAMVASLDDRPAIAVTTAPFDPITDALIDLAGSLSSSFVLAEWGADVTWSEATAHKVALRSALDAPGIAHVPTPIDFSQTKVLIEVAGEVIAWSPDGGD